MQTMVTAPAVPAPPAGKLTAAASMSTADRVRASLILCPKTPGARTKGH